MSKRRVVITGIGTINAVGHSVDEMWENLLKGKSGIDKIKNFDAEKFKSQIAGEVKDYDGKDFFDRKELKKMDRYTQFALISAKEAIEQANLKDFDPDRAGVIIGAGIGGMETFENQTGRYIKRGPRRISPFFIPKMISNIAAAHIAIEHNFKAANFNVTSACASGNHAIGTAFRTIQYGDADIMVSGGTEASVTPMAVGGFSSMRALSTRNDDPEKASRPFDLNRDGFVIGEGAGMLILEEYEHAKKRGAKILAELVGYSATCDAYHITAPDPEGTAGAKAFENALKDADLKPEDIGYINAHGTSTPLNDVTETAIIKKVFGDHAKNLKVNSTKSMVGHTLGAAAGIEAIVCVKSISDGKLHPTKNLENPDPKCDLDYVPNKMEEVEITAACSNSLGFGGHNGVVVFKKID